MKHPGLHNPFAKPEPPKPIPTFSDDFLYEELPRGSGYISLDGDSYALRFASATMENIKERLYALLYEVNQKHALFLQDNGIRVAEHLEPKSGELLLKTKDGDISIFSKEDNEVVAFRRIAYTLSQLSIPDILKKHNVKIIERR